jgi:hypothetical protein
VSNFLKVLASILTIGILACIVVIARVELTTRESTLLGVLLAVISILATWLFSHVYAQSQHEQAIHEVQEMHRSNLRTYALKAAEKVNNLSNELNRLVLYLEQAIAETEHESPEEALLAREERITSAIHIANTLKSVNDTSLSDWRGVIGEELDQQREEREEWQAEVTELMTRVETLEKSHESDIDKRDLSKEIDSIKNSMRLIVGGLTGLPLNYPRSFKPKGSAEAHCPTCSTLVAYRHKPKNNSIKAVKCQACHTLLVSKYVEDRGYSLAPRVIRTELIKCPDCDAINEVKLDSAPSSTAETECSACQNPIRYSRTASDSINVRNVTVSLSSTPVEMTEDVIDKVRLSLPPQPWPDGTGRKVAQQLKLSRETVQRAIRELINRGVFKHQVDGVLYVPIPSANGSNEENLRDGKAAD